MPRTLRPCAAIVASCLVLVGGASAAGAPQRVSTDPFTNADSQHATEVEPDTFAVGNTIVSAFQSGRFFDGGSSDIGFALSTDGGGTWTHGFLPSITVNSVPAGPWPRASDPAVAYDARHGTWIITSLAIDNTGEGKAVLVSRSTDGGHTWSAPVTVASTSGFYDKTWIACDNTATSPHYGNCYETWDDTNAGDLLLSATSSDGGLTWGAKKRTGDSAAGLGGQPQVQPGGTVIVPVLSAFTDGLLAYRSTDGGATWSSSVTLSTLTDHEVAGGLRSEPLPSAEIDAAGKVYVAWHDCRFRTGCTSNDILLSTSTDGLAWTTPVRVPIDPVTSTVDHFIPGLAVDRTTSGATAHLGLTYHYYPQANCTPSTCQLSLGFIASVDGGATWSSPRRLRQPMKVTDLANTSQGYMVGDYISTSFVGANAVPVVAFGKPHAGNVFDEGMYTLTLPVRADGSFPQVTTDAPATAARGDRAMRAQPLVMR